jgi:hypothetical protein
MRTLASSSSVDALNKPSITDWIGEYIHRQVDVTVDFCGGDSFKTRFRGSVAGQLG